MTKYLIVRAGRDGTWVEFKTLNGLSAAFCIEKLALQYNGVIGKALDQWCKDMQEIRTDLKQCTVCEAVNEVDPPDCPRDASCCNIVDIADTIGSCDRDNPCPPPRCRMM